MPGQITRRSRRQEMAEAWPVTARKSSNTAPTSFQILQGDDEEIPQPSPPGRSIGQPTSWMNDGAPTGRTLRSFQESARSVPTNAWTESLQPLRTMADRVGKEVEKFAERLDEWYTHGREGEAAKYKATVRLVSRLKDHANATVANLKKKYASEESRQSSELVKKQIRKLRQSKFEQSPARRAVANPGKDSNVAELQYWQAEAATWELFQILISLYYHEPGSDRERIKQNKLSKLRKLNRYSSSEDIWSHFVLGDSKAHEKRLVLKWLERTAEKNESDIGFITQQLESSLGATEGDGTWSQGWLATRERIKGHKRTNAFGFQSDYDVPEIFNSEGTELVITQLDPDAPARQARDLENTDENYERSLWMACYEMMRRGKTWKEVCEWCDDRNEGWRAVSIGMASEQGDPSKLSAKGPQHGALWRRMCLLSSMSATHPYEKAVYGLLSGDLDSVKKVSRTWEDHLYAHYNSLLLSRFDTFLQKAQPENVSPAVVRRFPLKDTALTYGSWPEASRRVIEFLHEDEITRIDAESPIHLIQGSLLAQAFEELAYNVGIAIATKANEGDCVSSIIPKTTEKTRDCYVRLAEDPNSLRIVCHLLLIHKSFGIRSTNNKHLEMYENVIVGYIDLLRMIGKIDHIPIYATQLSESRIRTTLGHILPDIKNVAEQKTMVNLMYTFGINVEDVLSEHYEFVLAESGLDRDEPPIKKFTMLEPTDDPLWPGQRIRDDVIADDVTADERAIIDSLQWHLHPKRSWPVTFTALTEAMKTFLHRGRIKAALQLAEQLSVQKISELKSPNYFPNQVIDVMEWDGSEEPQQPDLRRSTRLGSKRPGHSRHNSQANSQPSAELQQMQRRVELLRGFCRTYFELTQLVTAIDLLSRWRAEEEELFDWNGRGQSPPKQNIRQLFDEIQMAMEPLLQDFLSTARDEAEAADLVAIRHAYLPDAVLAYAAVLQSAAHFLSREHLTLSMSLASQLAAPSPSSPSAASPCARDFQATGRMGELVAIFAHAARDMVRLGQGGAEKKRGERGERKRGWEGETGRIWDVAGAL